MCEGVKNNEKREDIGKATCRSGMVHCQGGETKIWFFLAECSLKRDLHFQIWNYFAGSCPAVIATPGNKQGPSQRNPGFLSSSSIPNATKTARLRFWIATCTMGTEILAGIKACAAQIRSSYQELERWRTTALCLGGWGPCLPMCCHRQHCFLPFGRLLKTLAWSCYCWSGREFCHWLQGDKKQTGPFACKSSLYSPFQILNKTVLGSNLNASKLGQFAMDFKGAQQCDVY